MLPTINGKEIIDCNLDDLRTIINNPDYAENEYLDYKRCFAIDVVEKEKKAQEQAEFRSDVCAFANSDGGYLFIGIDEQKGVPSQIEGIRLKNNNPDMPAYKKYYGDDYVEYDETAPVKHANIASSLDLMLLDMDMESDNPFDEDTSEEDFDSEEDDIFERDEYEYSDLDPEVFKDPTLLVKLLKKEYK